MKAWALYHLCLLLHHGPLHPGDSKDSSESGIEHSTAITEANFFHEVWEESRQFNTQDP